MNCISCPKVCKIVFRSKFLIIPEKLGRKEEEENRQFQNVMLFKQTQ